MHPLRFIGRRVLTGDAHATVDRLFVSRHVNDLRLILAASWIAVIVILILGPVVSVWAQAVTQWHDIDTRKSDWIFLRIALAGLANFGVFVTPALAVFGGILAWAYQVGSARLGVVDLFACEISTLCRITTVLDTVRRLVDKCNLGPQPSAAGSVATPTSQFSSQENYFPVFDSSGHDLQTLEARVVVNITAFYTYMKAMRDGMRSLAAIAPPPSPGPPPDGSPDPWHEGTRNVIYMLYLALESARKSVNDLVEIRPELIERTIVILISELAAYSFLCEQFANESDIRYQRIRLRGAEYRELEPQLRALVEAGRASERTRGPATPSQDSPPVSEWLPAEILLPELDKRYRAAIAADGVTAK
jgi:hypothetical protein